jgi:hypothetical protein
MQMRPIELLAWLYDIKQDKYGIRFVLFGFWTIHVLRFENIESVEEIGRFALGGLSAYNFKNRFLARTLIIKTRHGWFARKVLITPKEPDRFLDWLNAHEILVLNKL